MSFREYDAPIKWAFKKNKGIFKPISKNSLNVRSQDLKKNYYESASFIIFKVHHLFKKNIVNYYGYELKKKCNRYIKNRIYILITHFKFKI